MQYTGRPLALRYENACTVVIPDNLVMPLLIAGGLLGLMLLISCLLLIKRILSAHAEAATRSRQIEERLGQTLSVLEHGDNRQARQNEQLREFLLQQLDRSRAQAHDDMNKLSERFADLRTGLERRMGDLQTQVLERLASGTHSMGKQVAESLSNSTEQLTKQVEKLTLTTDNRLKDISNQVDERLKQGFEKTTSTFTEVVKRLALIDEAQKRITELSTNVVSLQEILSDKRSRGAFGEVQLEALVRNALPDQHVEWQYTLSNGTRVDCLLRLPPPTGDVCIDAKFPLENFQAMTDPQRGERDRLESSRRFKQDIKKHLNDIADKYIIPDETAIGAIMFVPAESIFAEIHAHHADLVKQAHDRGVWICSPSTLMAVLTTARAVLRDDALRKQAGKLRQYLIELNTEFDRFRTRMDKLSRHIESAHEETRKVHITADKISKRFAAIEQVQTDSPDALPAQPDDD